MTLDKFVMELLRNNRAELIRGLADYVLVSDGKIGRIIVVGTDAMLKTTDGVYDIKHIESFTYEPE